MLMDTTVVKVGGNEVDDAGWTTAFARAVAAMTHPVVVVHGGGKEVSDVQRLLGAEPEWHQGLRVTTPAALRAVSMVLSGVVNKRLVSALGDAGVSAVGISGEDASLLEAAPANGGSLGRTGTIQRVNTRLLTTLLSAGMVPVVSPVSRDVAGGALNVNADEAAAAVAGAIGAERLLLISNVPGYLGDGAVIPQIDVLDVEALIESGEAAGGMAPKLRAAAAAVRGGAGEVRIGDLDMLLGRAEGTRIGAADAACAGAGPRMVI